jgi:hypothetical protein
MIALGAGDVAAEAFWKDLAAADADVVLNGHRHLYARLVPLDAAGAPSAAGIRPFVVGTGGANLFGQAYSDIVAAHNASEYGVLMLTLHAGSYEWQFEPEAGGLFTDYGAGPCH